jgi:hypothetical protein
MDKIIGEKVKVFNLKMLYYFMKKDILKVFLFSYVRGKQFMTTILAYTWQDKIIMMADSREYRKDNGGNVVEFNDEQVKLIPVQKRLVFAHTGLRKAYIGEGQYYDLMDITKHFIEANIKRFAVCTGKEVPAM